MFIKLKKLNKVSSVAGYRNFFDFLLKFALPVLSIIVLVGLFSVAFIDILPAYTGIIMIGVGTISVFAYPYVRYGMLQQDINDHMHLFITYAGTVSTMKINRGVLFQKIAEKEIFGEISTIFKKIKYLATSWNLGYADACRTMVPRIPSAIMADFIDRLAVIMDFGEDLEVFLFDEQEAVMDDYAVEYNKSIETIKMLQELFIAVSISFAFLIGVGLLAPLLLEIPLTDVLLFGVIGLVLFDVLVGFAIFQFLPKDKLFHELKDKSRDYKKMRRVFFLTLLGCFVLGLLLYLFTNLMALFIIAISLTPMLYPAILANQLEENIIRRDKQFPVYARVLGSAIEIRNGGVVSALKSTQTHDFGVLQEMSMSLYRRLQLQSDKYKTWYLFAVESGSNLISNFSKIFMESVYLGGNAEKIGEIISKNMQQLIGLRKYRMQLVGSIRGAFYGSMIGLIATIFVSARISELLLDIFRGPQVGSDVGALVDTLIPDVAAVNFDTVMIYMTIIVIVQAASAAWIMKGIDGGTIYAAVFDFILLVWIGALLAYFLPIAIDGLIPEFGDVFADVEGGDVDAVDIDTGLG